MLHNIYALLLTISLLASTNDKIAHCADIYSHVRLPIPSIDL
jgi:hypothetical protein